MLDAWLVWVHSNTGWSLQLWYIDPDKHQNYETGKPYMANKNKFRVGKAIQVNGDNTPFIDALRQMHNMQPPQEP